MSEPASESLTQVEERQQTLAQEVARLRKVNQDLTKKNALLEADRNQLLQVLRERKKRIPPPIKARDLKKGTRVLVKNVPPFEDGVYEAGAGTAVRAKPKQRKRR